MSELIVLAKEECFRSMTLGKKLLVKTKDLSVVMNCPW